MRIQAYFDEWSVFPGDTVKVATSTEFPELRATFERVLSGPGDPKNPYTKVEERLEILDAKIAGRVQETSVGSWAELPTADSVGPRFAVAFNFWPTMLETEKVQTLFSAGGIAIELVGGQIQVKSPSGIVRTDEKLLERRWFSLSLEVADEATLEIRCLDKFEDYEPVRVAGAAEASRFDAVRLATEEVSEIRSALSPYNGKIEALVILDGNGEVAAKWDFSKGMGTQTVFESVAGDFTGSIINEGDRAVTGSNWDGSHDSYLVVPEQYNVLQFHEDDMIESGWKYDLEFALPADLPSGIYAVRLSGSGETTSFPLFVKGARGTKAKILYLVSTHTYLAYANDHLAEADWSLLMNHKVVLPEDEQYLFDHPEMGLACYDTHSDGSPNRYSSRRRPIVNIRPGYPNFLTGSYRNFSADLYQYEWLHRTGIDYHIATDDDLWAEGKSLLEGYSVVVTSGHHEYWTGQARDGLQEYLEDGGRLMYLSGNGLYWITTVDPARPWVIELRRDNGGTRFWDAPLGERGHRWGGEVGGLWRWRGKGPNELVGVGFSSEGWAEGQPFRRQEGSYSDRFKCWFDGITDSKLGTEGYILGAAVGDEFDRWDPSLGSPLHAVILASAYGFPDEYQLVLEDQTAAQPNQGGQDRPDKVRADMIFFEIQGGGAVFTAPSMNLGASMAWNDFDNSLATVITRVLRGFAGESEYYPPA